MTHNSKTQASNFLKTLETIIIVIHHQSDVIWCSTQRGGSLLTEAVCVLSLLKIPAGKGAVVLFTYLLMSSWFIRKGTFSQPLSWRVLCKGRPGLPISLAEMMVGLSVMGLEGRGGEGLLHKHGSQSAGIAPHSRGASAGLYRGSLFCGPLHFLTHHPSVLIWSPYSYVSVALWVAKFPVVAPSEWVN